VLFWSDSRIDEPWCPRCVAAELLSQGGDLDGWFWEPWTCEVCGRPARGRLSHGRRVCSEQCAAARRAVRRERRRRSPWDLDCRACGRRIEQTVVYGVPQSPAPLCAACAIGALVEWDRRLLEQFGPDGPFGLTRGRAMPGDEGYDPLQRLEARPCPVCARAVRGRRVCSDHCEAQRENVRRRVEQQERDCAHCGEPFTPRRRDARYCSGRCRVAATRARAAPAGGS